MLLVPFLRVIITSYSILLSRIVSMFAYELHILPTYNTYMQSDEVTDVTYASEHHHYAFPVSQHCNRPFLIYRQTNTNVL